MNATSVSGFASYVRPAALVVALLFVGCGGDGDRDGDQAAASPRATEASPGSPTAASPAARRAFEPASYTASIRGVPHRWEFRADGGFTIYRDGNPFQKGAYEIKGDQLELTDEDSSPASCAPDTEPGIYRWAYDGKSLTFERERDTCVGRSGDVLRTWTRQ